MRSNRVCSFSSAGTVQDAFDPEYFQAEACCVNESTGAQFNVTCKYRDTIHVPPGCKVTQALIPQRHISPHHVAPVPFCVPVPGENAWARATHTNENSRTVGSWSTAGAEDVTREGATKRCARCRGMAGTADNDDDDAAMDGMSLPRAMLSATKRNIRNLDAAPPTVSSLASAGSNSTSSPSKAVQLPISSEDELPRIVKVYDADTLSFPVNQVYDFVGASCPHCPCLVPTRQRLAELLLRCHRLCQHGCRRRFQGRASGTRTAH